MKQNDLLQEFTDFRRKLKTEIQSAEFSKSPQKNYTKTQSSPQKQNLRSKIHLAKHGNQIQQRCNTLSSLQQQIQTLQDRDMQCITHTKFPRNVQKQLPKQKKLNITDRLLNYTQLNNLYFSLQQLSDEETKSLSEDYKQILNILAQNINQKITLKYS